ncbi:hypothetical protein G5V59_10290 [Nocardioides sp. W3-2-3]|nr:hypothetical protein [Nocardioides convexus]
MHPIAAEPDRFHDGGTDAEPPDPASPPRIVLERVESGDLQRRTESLPDAAPDRLPRPRARRPARPEGPRQASRPT